jgi:predicted O-linked N-acetylglucosamine transferase (SPINDLY family)
MPTLGEALQIAVAHQQAGRFASAAEVCRQILAAMPEHAETLHRLGLIAFAQGQYEQALECIERAIRNDPGQAHFHNNRGMVCRALGRIDDAADEYEQSLRLNPDSPQAWYDLGNLRRSQGALGRAVECYQRALRLKPDYALAELNLGAALLDQGEYQAAIACYQHVAALQPDFPGLHNNLGVAWQLQGKLSTAIECFQRAIQLQPRYADAHSNLGNALLDQGRLDASLDCYRQAIALCPESSTARSNYLCALRYSPDVPPAEMAAACAEYERQYAAPLAAQQTPCENSRVPDRRLRLGFVSPDFAQGPVGAFLIGPLENLDRRRVEIYCYSDRLTPDQLTARFRTAATAWRDAIGLSDADLARQIRTDRIDILFDLAGHVPRNRLLVFARRPAPIQITWIDSVGTTGLKTIDYVLADRHTIPPEAEPYYAERVLRMPDCSICYEPPADAPPVGPLPAIARGAVTFACFNRPAKIHARVIELWCRILTRVPRSRLILKHAGFDDPGTIRHFAELFARHGVEPGRVEMRGMSPRAEYFRQYQEVDLALDPSPHSGGLTTCDALWMGVPVVTCPGATFASRQGLSYLSTIGLTETLAGDAEQYVDLAAGLACDLPRLAALRDGMRTRVAQSPLCDPRRFAANLLDLLREVWQAWVA